MRGYRTYTGLVIALLGALGFGELITEEELTQLTDLSLTLGGIIMAAYGRYKTHDKK